MTTEERRLAARSHALQAQSDNELDGETDPLGHARRAVALEYVNGRGALARAVAANHARHGLLWHWF